MAQTLPWEIRVFSCRELIYTIHDPTLGTCRNSKRDGSTFLTPLVVFHQPIWKNMRNVKLEHFLQVVWGTNNKPLKTTYIVLHSPRYIPNYSRIGDRKSQSWDVFLTKYRDLPSFPGSRVKAGVTNPEKIKTHVNPPNKFLTPKIRGWILPTTRKTMISKNSVWSQWS